MFVQDVSILRDVTWGGGGRVCIRECSHQASVYIFVVLHQAYVCVCVVRSHISISCTARVQCVHATMCCCVCVL